MRAEEAMQREALCAPAITGAWVEHAIESSREVRSLAPTRNPASRCTSGATAQAVHLDRHRCAGSDERMAGFGSPQALASGLDERIPVIPADRPGACRIIPSTSSIGEQPAYALRGRVRRAPRSLKDIRPLARRSSSQPRNSRSELFTVYSPSDQQSEDRAIRPAKGLASGHLGVIAWSREADPPLGDCSSLTLPTWNKI